MPHGLRELHPSPEMPTRKGIVEAAKTTIRAKQQLKPRRHKQAPSIKTKVHAQADFLGFCGVVHVPPTQLIRRKEVKQKQQDNDQK